MNKTDKAVELFKRTDAMHRCAFNRAVKSLDIHRSQHMILMQLDGQDKLPSQKELAKRLDVTPAAVTGAIKKMEKDGYVERTLGHDNRFIELRITEKGRELVRKTHKLFSEADNSMFEGFSESELEAYISCLAKLQANIKKQYERKDD